MARSPSVTISVSSWCVDSVTSTSFIHCYCHCLLIVSSVGVESKKRGSGWVGALEWNSSMIEHGTATRAGSRATRGPEVDTCSLRWLPHSLPHWFLHYFPLRLPRAPRAQRKTLWGPEGRVRRDWASTTAAAHRIPRGRVRRDWASMTTVVVGADDWVEAPSGIPGASQTVDPSG